MRRTICRRWFTALPIRRLIATVVATQAASRTQPDDEQQIGQQVFDELKAKGQIIASSPLYDSLTPIADAVTRDGAASLQPSVQVLSRARAAAERLLGPWRQRLRDRLPPVLREEHGGIDWNVVPRSGAHDSSRLDGLDRERAADRAPRDRGCRVAGPVAGPHPGHCADRKAAFAWLLTRRGVCRGFDGVRHLCGGRLPTRGASCGCSRTSRPLILRKCRSCSPTIRTTRIGSRRSNGIFASIPEPSDRFRPTLRARNHSRFPRMPRWCSCVERRSATALEHPPTSPSFARSQVRTVGIYSFHAALFVSVRLTDVATCQQAGTRWPVGTTSDA